MSSFSADGVCWLLVFFWGCSHPAESETSHSTAAVSPVMKSQNTDGQSQLKSSKQVFYFLLCCVVGCSIVSVMNVNMTVLFEISQAHLFVWTLYFGMLCFAESDKQLHTLFETQVCYAPWSSFCRFLSTLRSFSALTLQYSFGFFFLLRSTVAAHLCQLPRGRISQFLSRSKLIWDDLSQLFTM